MSLINKSKVKARLLHEAKVQRPKKKPVEVDGLTIHQAEDAMGLWCKIHVSFLPKNAKKI